MKKSEIFVLALSSFCLGVLFATLFVFGKFLLIFYLALFILIFVYRIFNVLTLKVFFIFLFCFLIGAFRFFCGESELIDESFFNIVVFEISGEISAEPDLRSTNIKYVLKDVVVKDGDSEYFLNGKLLMNGPIYPEYHYGERLIFYSKIEKPFSNFEFNYENYLYRYGIYWLSKNPLNIKVIEESSGFSRIISNLFLFKNLLINRLTSIYGEPYSSFMSGILLGLRKGFSSDLTESFKNSGLTHIVAVSGYNITILIAFVYGFFSFLGQKPRIFLALFFIISFVFMSGMSASAIRAGIMGAVSLFAILFGRTYQVKIALFFSAFLMILIEPKILFFDIGFQLSFLATIGLVYLSPLIEGYFNFMPNFLEIRSSFVLTISATFTTLPILALNFGILSLISPIANLCVLPFIPFVMLFSFLSLLISYFSMFVALIIGFLAFLITKYIFFIITVFGNFSFSVVSVEMIPGIFWFLYFCILFFEIYEKSDDLKISDDVLVNQSYSLSPLS